MNLQPHIIVLHWIRSEFKRLSRHPDYVNFSLGGYCYTPSMSSIYGAKFIDNAINWFQNNEKNFSYVLGYRLDISKIPAVSVTMSGGSEQRQLLGDYGGSEIVDVSPQKYATFHASGITEEGFLIVPNEYALEEKIWRGLVIHRDNLPETRTITGLIKPSSDSDLQIIADRPFVLSEGLSGWNVYSCSSARKYVIGSSFDRVTINVYLDIPGDPELCEVMSSITRAALKNARLHLIENGLNEVQISYTPIGQNTSYSGVNVWTAQFTISALMTDRWFMSDSLLPDNIKMLISCERNIE